MSTDTESPRRSVPVPGMRRLTQAQFGGVMALVVGVSQMIVGIIALDGLLAFIMGSGGGLLAVIGSNLIRNRPAFYNGWKEDGDYGSLSLLIIILLTVCVLIAVGLILLG